MNQDGVRNGTALSRSSTEKCFHSLLCPRTLECFFCPREECVRVRAPLPSDLSRYVLDCRLRQVRIQKRNCDGSWRPLTVETVQDLGEFQLVLNVVRPDDRLPELTSFLLELLEPDDFVLGLHLRQVVRSKRLRDRRFHLG